MRFTFLIALTVIATIGASTSAAATVIDAPSDSPHPYQRWIDRSHASTPSGSISVELSDAPCGTTDPEIGGCAVRGQRLIILRPDVGRWTFLHEIGHQFDFLILKPRQRHALKRLMRVRAMPWIGGAEEHFADLWAVCARYKPFRRWQIGFFYVGKPERRRLLGRNAIRKGCALIERAANRSE